LALAQAEPGTRRLAASPGAAALVSAFFVFIGGAACSPERPAPNIVLVTLDTTRPDHLGPYGYALARTPNLDRFAQGATLYERAYATSSWTLASHASIFTGLLPRQHGAQSVPRAPNQVLGYGVRPLSASFVTLAELLSQAGYRTGAVVAGPALRRELGTAQGFEIYRDELRGREEIDNGKRAQHTTDLGLAMLGDFGNDPFFLFVNYFDPHAPYEPPAGFNGASGAGGRADPDPDPGNSLIATYIRRLNAGAEPVARKDYAPAELAEIAELVSGYDAEIAYMDHHLGRLLDALQARPGRRETWILVTGDHGESFGEHYFLSHGAHLYEDNVRVPLMVHAPGQAEAVRRLGGDFFDRDLVALVTSPFKLIRSSRGEVELYELSRDPEEIRDLRSQQPGVAETLEKRLSALEARTPPIHPSALNLELRDETVEALRAMGYLE